MRRDMIIVLISSKVEWDAVKELLSEMHVRKSPFGEWGELDQFVKTEIDNIVFFHGGWGKIKAAASTQFVIDKFAPDLILNIGTCGGFAEEVEVGQIILAEKTIVYDIQEKMSDADQATSEYSTTLDIGWLKNIPPNVRPSLLVSGDSDLDPEVIGILKRKYGAIAGDWESGSIAHICELNCVPCLILRGISDLVSETQGEAYDKPGLFLTRTQRIMTDLIDSLPFWIKTYKQEVLHNKVDSGGADSMSDTQY